MIPVVVDASVVIKWALPEPDREIALRVDPANGAGGFTGRPPSCLGPDAGNTSNRRNVRPCATMTAAGCMTC